MLRLLERISEGHEENQLVAGAQINVWWPRYNRCFPAEITEISGASIELHYADGEQRTYLPNEIIPRIAIGEVCHKFKSHNHVGYVNMVLRKDYVYKTLKLVFLMGQYNIYIWW